MTERAILQALQTAVIAARDASILPGLQIKCVGVPFTPPDDGKGWLEIIHIPNNVTDEFWSSGKTYRGFMRLILYWPVDSEGAYPAMDLIESIGSYFTKGMKITDSGPTVRVTITDNPNFLGVLEEPPYILYPLSIRYQFLKA